MQALIHTHRKRLLLPLVVVFAIVASTLNLSQYAEAQDGQPLNWDEPVLGQITTPQGTLFNFQANAGDTANIEVLGLGGLQPSIVLQDTNRAIVAQEPNNARDNTTTLTYTIFTSGIYYVQVQGVDNTLGQFTILLSRGLPPGIPLEIGTPIDGIVSPDFPAVYYDFPANPDTITRLTIRSLSEGYGPMATVMNSNGDIVAAVIGEALVGATLELRQGSETYKLMVEIGTFPETANFQVTLNYGPEQPSEDTASSSQPPSSGGDTSSSSSSNCQLSSLDNSDIRIRAGGSTDHEIIGLMPANTSLPATGYNQANGGWYEVRMNDGNYGWMASFVVFAAGDGCNSLPIKSYPDPGSSSGPSGTEEPGDGTTTPTTTVTPTPSSTVAGIGPSPTYTYTPSATSTSPGPDETEEVTGPTSTYTYTPSATYTYQPPTATYTPSYTPTTPPADQIAPEDSRTLAPLIIPLDNTASRLDFVSYPNGDTEDRIQWDITGMNPNVALPGGRARLVIAVSCFGQGTQYITFFTGGQTYTCGQTIVDREVTYDTRTGLITITATGGQGTYVQWVLTGTATRIN